MIKLKKILGALLHPKRILGLYYRGVDYWPPSNYRRHYRFKFYFIELPLRWIFGGVIPQDWDGRAFKTFFDEDVFINEFFKSIGMEPKSFVDIGAGDGIDMSNTFMLARNGLAGLSIEGSPVRFSQMSLTYEKFSNVNLVRTYVSSSSVSNLIKGFQNIPADFDVLNLDIDSYDYHVLNSVLTDFSPKLCVIEWNRAFPPSIFFTVKDIPNIRWDPSSPIFNGASLRAFGELLDKFDYKIIGIQGAALFACPNNIAPNFQKFTVSDAWNQYINGPLKWREPNQIHDGSEKGAIITYFLKRFEKFKGLYDLY